MILGCTDNSAINYNELADFNDNSCEYPGYGCTDLIADNYSPDAFIFVNFNLFIYFIISFSDNFLIFNLASSL